MFSSIAPVQARCSRAVDRPRDHRAEGDPAFPELPCIASPLARYESGLIGLSAPANTPREIIKRRGRQQQALNAPDVKTALAAQGGPIATSEEFDAFIEANATSRRR